MYRRIVLIPGAGAATARSVANWFQLTVAPASQNLTALNATVAVEATVASVGWGRSMLQAAARSAAGPSNKIRLNMVPASVRRWIRRMQPRVTARPLIDVASTPAGHRR